MGMVERTVGYFEVSWGYREGTHPVSSDWQAWGCWPRTAGIAQANPIATHLSVTVKSLPFTVPCHRELYHNPSWPPSSFLATRPPSRKFLVGSSYALVCQN